jgi:membrane-bound ClpP family serine protease
MTIIILLILTGILLLLLEFFVFPGVTIAALGGLIMIGGGVYMAYNTYDATTGHIVLFVTIVAILIVLGMALRGDTWNKLMLNTEITENVQTVADDSIQPGDKGVTTTRLNPIGKALINDLEVEAKCPGQFVDQETDIEVVKVFKNYVIVKTIN